MSPFAPLLFALFLCPGSGLVENAFTQPSFLFVLGDDIGWADPSYPNNGTAHTPNLRAWATAPGSIYFQDFHTGGTVCSPTRATVLTGRNHFRDCVNYVYGCSDMTECVPDFEFAPKRTFTIGDAVRAANKGYTSHFGGKWHLGSFFNDSESFAGLTSSPVTHGFDHFNATVEVAPTATLNCECNAAWQSGCDYGHYGEMTHCAGSQGPDPNASKGCCFNYWWDDASAAHAVSNFTMPTPDDDAEYNADAFVRFLEGLDGAPFLAQISFHNCHIPFVGTPSRRAACNSTAECEPTLPGTAPYTDMELDYYACLNELDNSVGTVLAALRRLGYYDNTMTWFTVDNGPEVNCAPEGRCGSGTTGVIPPGTLHRPDCDGPGSAGPLRGRKRDVWEGGHRVPGLISWPAVVGTTGPARVSWDPVVTMDFLATIMDVLDVQRPAAQADWGFDGVSVMPILRGETPAPRGIGWMYLDPVASTANGYAFRYDNWKYVVGGISCNEKLATFNCSAPQLYDMSTDYAENHDLAAARPDVLAAIAANFSAWYASVHYSINNESECAGSGPTPPAPFPPNPTPSSNCTFMTGSAMNGADVARATVGSLDECCGACRAMPDCGGADYEAASPMHPTFTGSAVGGTCHIKAAYNPRSGLGTQTAIRPLH